MKGLRRFLFCAILAIAAMSFMNLMGPAASVSASVEKVEEKEAIYMASRHSTRFHDRSCQWVKRIKRENRISFARREAALQSGYLPCKVCKP